jgi:hypothetical protein
MQIELPPGTPNNFLNPNEVYFKELEDLALKYSKGIDIPSDYSRLANKYGVKTDALMKKISEYASKYSEDFSKGAEQTIKNAAKAAPMETPYGKSFLSYTPEGKIAGVPGKVLRGLGKVAGPVGAALTVADMGGALAELRKLGAEKIAKENEVKEMQAPVSQLRKYTPEERMRVKEMLKKLGAEAKLRS